MKTFKKLINELSTEKWNPEPNNNNFHYIVHDNYHVWGYGKNKDEATIDAIKNSHDDWHEENGKLYFDPETARVSENEQKNGKYLQ